MKRRTALKQLGFGLSAGMVLPGLISSCVDEELGPEIKYDGTVVIIGAGASGLYAAEILQNKGITIKILEAADVAGGRVRSVRGFADFPLELGADRMYGTDGAWTKLVRNSRVPVEEFRAVSNDRFIVNEQIAEESTDINAALAFAENLRNYNGANVSLLQAAQSAGLSANSQRIVNSLIAAGFGSDMTSLDAKAIAEALSLRTIDNREFVLVGNPQQDMVLSRFSRVLPFVQYNTQASVINSNEDLITITDGEGNIIEANKVIIAVPVSMLKNGSISFAPGLPEEKSAALSRIGMAPAIKMALDFNKNFWGDATALVLGGQTGHQYFNAGITRSEFRRVLHVLVFGEKAAELSELGEGVLPQVIEELDKLYAGEASKHLKEDFFIKDWSKEPFVQGGYSYPMLNGSNLDRIALAAPIGGKIFFAGEATDIMGEFGTMNGAIAAGERSALEVIDAILQEQS